MHCKIILIICITFYTNLLAEESLEQPKDFYVEMAALNLFTYKTAYKLEVDQAGKLSLAKDMAFICFNYFVQREKGIIRYSAAFDKAVRVTYAGMKPMLGDQDPYFNPCGWVEGADEPKLQFPKTHRLTHPEYLDMTRKFIAFLMQDTTNNTKDSRIIK